MKPAATSEAQNQIIWFNSDLVPTFKGDWFTNDYWQKKQAVTGLAEGRGTTTFFNYANQHMVLRHYLRGGLPGKILTDQYFYTGLGQTRAWKELHLLLQMQELGLPVPTPVAARVRKSGLVYRSDIVLLKIEQAKDVHNILLETPVAEKIWRKIGHTIAHFHRFGIYHHDLNIHNIMIDADEKIWLIDFDKCAIKRGKAWKQHNLQRLLRSLNKESYKNPGYHFSEENWQQLMSGYLEFPYSLR